MRKRVKILMSLVLIFSLLLGMVVVGGVAVSARNSIKTQAEAVGWLNAQSNATYDFDGVYGTQCVEFVKAYVNWLLCGDAWTDCWQSNGWGGATGNGDTIWQNPLWSQLGWAVYEYYSGFVPQPGDIFSAYGVHTGIVISSDATNAVVAEANAVTGVWTNGDPVIIRNIRWGMNDGHAPSHIIRPNFSASSVVYDSIPTGNYTIRNCGSNSFLVVEGSVDVSKQNIGVHPITPESGMKMEITETSLGYRIRPHCSGNRIVNVYSDNVMSGDNVNLLGDTVDPTKRWLFEALDDGSYIIRNGQNPSCVLTQQNEGFSTNCIVADYTGSAYQKWELHALESEKPVISKVQIQEITADGYTIVCTIADNASVRRVRFPTWTVQGDQDDLIWADGNVTETTASFRVNKWDHNNEQGEYVTHIYAYDSSGNERVCAVNVWVTAEGAEVTWADVWSGCEHRYDVTSTATCVAAGKDTYTCSNCGYSYSVEAERSSTHTFAVRYGTSGPYQSISHFRCWVCKEEYTYDLGVTYASAYPVSSNEIEIQIDFSNDDHQLYSELIDDMRTAISNVYPEGVEISDVNIELSEWTYTDTRFTARLTLDDAVIQQMIGDVHRITLLFHKKEHSMMGYGGYVCINLQMPLGQYVYLKPGESIDLAQAVGMENISGYYLESYDTTVVDCVNGICTAKAAGKTVLVLSNNTSGALIGCTIVVMAPLTSGDINLDGIVNLNDATNLFYYVNGLTVLTGDALEAADYSKNGVVDLNDATRLFYYINGLT